MNQVDLIPKIKDLCIEGKYDEAIALTNLIENKRIAIEAHLLCIEHEQAILRQSKKKASI